MFEFLNKSFDSQVLSKIVPEVLSGLFEKKSGEKFSQEPTSSVKKIAVEATNRERMAASGFNKLLGRCFLSVITLYLSPAQVKSKKPCGTMVLYIRQSCAIQILKALGYVKTEKATENELATFVSEFFTEIANNFNKALAQNGYGELTISDTTDFMDKAIGGADFPYAQSKYQEFRFFLWKQEAIILDVVLTPIPKK